MNDYFPMEQSIGYRMGSEGKTVLRTIADRYVSDNPPVPVKYYLRSRENFHISEAFCPITGTYHISGTGSKPSVLFLDGQKMDMLNCNYHISLRLAGGYHNLAFLGWEISVEVKDENG